MIKQTQIDRVEKLLSIRLKLMSLRSQAGNFLIGPDEQDTFDNYIWDEFTTLLSLIEKERAEK